MLPERSNATIVSKASESSDETYKCDALNEFNLQNDKKIAEELSRVHSSNQLSLALIDGAVKQFGSNSIEVKNLVATKIYQDSINCAIVTKIIDKYGWPGAERIGAQNNYTLYTTIQNADLNTQEKYLPVMEKAVRSGTLAPEHYASLVDRKALVQHQKQIYGTQITGDWASGEFFFAPIADEQTVNVRRKEIGLPPIEEYAKGLNIVHSSSDKTI